MSFIKGLIAGTVLTWVVSLIIGSNQSRGGALAIHHEVIAGYGFYWSWPLFIASTCIAWGIAAMME